MRDIKFSGSVFQKEYVYWQTQNKRTLNRINEPLKDIARNGNEGIGNPEPLKGDLSGKWSREIDEKNRLVYKVTDDVVEVYQCKGHYSDK